MPKDSHLDQIAWSGWPVKDAKASGTHRYSGFVYVAEASDGWIKVGCSTGVRRRMADHAKDAVLRGARIERVYISKPHANWRDNERSLIAECSLHASQIQGNEYFRGLDFAKTVLYLDGLPQKVRTAEEVERMEQRYAVGMDTLYGRLAQLEREAFDPHAADADQWLASAIVQRTAVLELENEKLSRRFAILDKWFDAGDAIDLDTFAASVGVESGSRLAELFGEAGIFDRSVHAIRGMPKDLPEFEWLHCFKVFVSPLPTGGFADVAWITPQGQLEIVEELRNHGLIDF